ncbi:hypothetical protein [Rhodococcus koreensis]
MLAGLVPPEGPGPLDGIVWQLMADDPTLLTAPTLPLGDLITAAGYVCDGDVIAAAGFDFAAHRGKSHAAKVAAAHHLTDQETDSVMAFTALIGVLEHTPDDERERAVDAVVATAGDRFAHLASPNAARAAFGEAYATLDAGTDTLHRAAAVLRDRGTPRPRSPPDRPDRALAGGQGRRTRRSDHRRRAALRARGVGGPELGRGTRGAGPLRVRSR